MILKEHVRVMLPVPLLGALTYCLYGFTTTFEPLKHDSQLAWRSAYAGGCCGSLLLLALLLMASIGADRRQHSP
jgi:hypothetical protein